MKHGHKNRKDCLEIRAKLDILGTYVKNQAILEPTLLCRALEECKQTEEDYSYAHIFTFLWDYYKSFFLILSK